MKKGNDNNSNLPKPKLIWKDEKPIVSDGWIMGSKFIIKKQPSVETIDFVNEFFAQKALKYQNEGIIK